MTGTSFHSARSGGVSRPEVDESFSEDRPRLDALKVSSRASASGGRAGAIAPPHSPMAAPAGGAVVDSASRHLFERHILNASQDALYVWYKAASASEAQVRDYASKCIFECIKQKSPTLNLCSLGLTDLPENVLCHARHLKTLFLANNKLSSLSNDFVCLTELVRLDISSNRFTELPYSVVGLGRLELIDMSNNELTHLPPHLLGLPRLNVVKCQNNPLAEVPLTNYDAPSSPLIKYSREGRPAQARPAGVAKSRLDYPHLPPILFTRNEKGDVIGGYQKIHKKHGHYHQTHSSVCSESDRKYALLNYLKTSDKARLEEQHGVPLLQGKMVLGKGGYGKARLAKDLSTKQILVVKKVNKESAATAEYATNQLIKASAGLNGVSDVDLQNNLLLISDRAKVNRYDSEGGKYIKTYLFMPFAPGGDGHKKITQLFKTAGKAEHRDQAENIVFTLMPKWAANVATLHKLNFTHRDVKPENFLHDNFEVDASGKLVCPHSRLGDHGLACGFEYNTVAKGGTREYFPPEYGRDGEYDALKHDSFSLGLSLLKLLSTVHKTDNRRGVLIELTLKDASTVKLQMNAINHLGHIRFQGLDITAANAENLSEEVAINVIALLLAKDPNVRITAQEAQERLESCAFLT